MSYLPFYYPAAMAVLAVLTFAILAIGRSMAQCPDTGTSAKSASIVIAIGYAACGLGGVILASVLPIMAEKDPLTGAVLGLGLVALGLGIGFAMAMTSLNDVVKRAQLLKDGLNGKQAA